MKSPGVWLCWD